MRTKEEIDTIKNRMAAKRESGELITHKCMMDSMSVAEKFRFNVCLKIMEIRISNNLPKNAFVDLGVSIEEMRRIQHKHYDFFETDRLLEILNIALVSSKSGKLEDIKIA